MNQQHPSLYRTLSVLLLAGSMLGCSSCDDRESNGQPDDGISTPDIATPNLPDVTLPPPDAKTDVETDVVAVPDKLPPVDSVDITEGPPEIEVCEGAYGSVETSAVLEGESLKEISGLVAASTSNSFFWAHNDSGDTARLFALGTDGVVHQEVFLEGVTAIDFEDIARGACPDGDGSCLWVADTGNNFRNRDTLTLYVIQEPDLSLPPRPALLTVPVKRRYQFSYPDGNHDAEALIVSPSGTSFWIFEKTASEQARVYQGATDVADDTIQTLTKVVTFQSPGYPINMGRMITGADLHPGEERIVLRVYTGSYEYRLSTPLGLEELATTTPIEVAVGPIDELQGEAIAYSHDGLSIWTCSEDPTFIAQQPLHYYPCLDSSP